MLLLLLRFLGPHEEIDILETWHRGENALQEAAFPQMTVEAHKHLPGEQTFSNHFNSILYSGPLKLQSKVAATLPPPPSPPHTFQGASAHCDQALLPARLGSQGNACFVFISVSITYLGLD